MEEIKQINALQAMVFYTDEHFKAFSVKFNKAKVGEIITAYRDEFPDKFKALIDAPVPEKLIPKPARELTPTEKVIDRMYNWKQDSAYNYAKDIDGFPKKALKKLKMLSDKFGNCGWQDGAVYDELRDTNFKVAEMIGYKYDEEEDAYVKK